MQRCGGVVVRDMAGPGGHPLTGYGPDVSDCSLGSGRQAWLLGPSPCPQFTFL